MNKKAFISPLQLFIIFTNISIGAGILTLPRSVAEIAEHDMWMSVVVGGLLMFLSLLASIRLSQHFPEHTCLEYHRILLGPVLGQIINLVLLSLIIVLAALALRTFSTAVRMFLFDLTPSRIVAGSILALAVYATQYGYTPLLRMQQVSFLTIYVLFTIVLLLGLLGIRSEQFLPMLAEGIGPVLKGAVPSWFSFSGSELIAGLVFPYLIHQRSAVKTGIASIAFVTAIFTLTIIIVQGNLSPAATAHQVFPTITAFRDVEIPDTFIERLDGYFVSLWIVVYFNSLTNLLFCASFGVSRLLQLEDSRSLTVLLAPLMYYLSQLAPSIVENFTAGELFNKIGMVWGLGILPILLLLAWYRKKRQQTC